MLTGRLVIDWQLRRREVSEVVAVNGEKKQNWTQQYQKIQRRNKWICPSTI